MLSILIKKITPTSATPPTFYYRVLSMSINKITPTPPSPTPPTRTTDASRRAACFRYDVVRAFAHDGPSAAVGHSHPRDAHPRVRGHAPRRRPHPRRHAGRPVVAQRGSAVDHRVASFTTLTPGGAAAPTRPAAGVRLTGNGATPGRERRLHPERVPDADADRDGETGE